MRIVPLGDRVVLKRLPADERSRGGILLPETAREQPLQARVVSVGEGHWQPSGDHMPLQVREGDRVVIGPYSGTPVEIDGEAFLVLRESEILAVMESGR